MSRRPLPLRPSPGLLALALVAACSSPPAREPGAPPATAAAAPAAPHAPRVTFTCDPADSATLARIEPLVAGAVGAVEAWFGAPFPHAFALAVHPDRASFDASFPPEWGIERTECWMVATGVADGVQLLSPRAWKAEACEHDPADERHLAELLAHELVHVYHGQHNPSPDFVDVTGIDWFVEGLATLVSGQLDEARLASARRALAAGRGPIALADAWTGPDRYGFSGSLVAELERTVGRAGMLGLLSATSGEELLDAAGITEAELLARWRASLEGAPGR